MSKRALVVIDVQSEYISGKFRIEYPAVEISLPNIVTAMETAAREDDVLTCVVLHVLPNDAPIFADGSKGADLHPDVSAAPYDFLVTKTLPSVFSDPAFEPWLRENGVDTLTIVGYMTHNCNDATAREAMHKGYKVEMLSDATGSLPYKNKGGSVTAEELHRATLTVMESAYAAIMTTQEWMTVLRDGSAPSQDNIFFSNQRALGRM